MVTKKKSKRKVSRRKVGKKLFKKISTKRKLNIAKVGSISLAEEIKNRLQFGRDYVYKRIERITNEISKPSAWFTGVQKSENVTSSFVWTINKEQMFREYSKKYYEHYDYKGDLVRDPKSPKDSPMGFKPTLVIVLPDGKVVTPIRQFCDHKVLPRGTREAYFYSFAETKFPETIEGNSGQVMLQRPTITSHRAESAVRGTMIEIGYNEVEESSTDIIASANRSFALESVNDESVDVLTRTFQHCTLEQDHWIEGHVGSVIVSDKHLTKKDTLTFKALMQARKVLENEGVDTGNLVLYTSGKGIRDLTLDPELDSYIGFSRPSIITQSTVERICGIKLVRSSAVPKITKQVEVKEPAPETYLGRLKRVLLFRKQKMISVMKDEVIGVQSCLFIPNVTFGLVTVETLTMEAQRRNERQIISLTGTQKVGSVLKNKECAVRISHA